MKITKTYLRSACLVFFTIFAFAAQVRAEDASAATQPPAKKTVAVADFSAKSINVVIDKDIKDFTFTAEYISLLNSEMMTALVNDPTFDVIDRARLRDLAKNGNLADVTPSSMIELGKASGADYVVSGDIELLELDKRTQTFPGYSQTQLVGHMVVNLRVVEIATSHVIYAHKVDDVCTAALNQYSTITIPAFMEQLKSDTVRRLVSSISENISPIEVCAVHDGKVYLDRGEQAFQGGEILEIVSEADKVYDKNGNLLDIVEDHAGKVRVDTVRPKVSIATIIEESRPIQVGGIARRIEE